MWCFRNLFILVMGLFSSLCISVSAQADTSLTTTTTTPTTTTVVEKRVIVTPTPQAVCSAVEGHWEGDVWVATHNVCKYENRSEGVAWVQDYWSCTAAAADGTCTTWTWVPGHWVKTLP